MRRAIPVLLVLLSVNAMASGSLCWRSLRATAVFVVTASSAPGMMHVHFEATVSPGLIISGPPVASVDGKIMTITQIAGMVGYDPLPGMPDLFCQVEDLDVPAVPPGYYSVNWMYVAAPGNGALFSLMGSHFQLDITEPLPLTSCAAAAAPVAFVRDHQLFFSDLVTLQPATFASPEVEVSGNTITVTQRYEADVYSSDFETRCYSETVSLPFAPQPGSHYDVVWIYKSAYGQMQSTAAVQFVPRRRAAR